LNPLEPLSLEPIQWSCHYSSRCRDNRPCA